MRNPSQPFMALILAGLLVFDLHIECSVFTNERYRHRVVSRISQLSSISLRSLQNVSTSCDDLLQIAYTTDYQQRQRPCTCSIQDSVTFHVSCVYDYCPDCIKEQSCAIQSTTDYYDNTGHFQQGSYCIQYTNGPFQYTKNCFMYGRSDAVARFTSDDTGLFCDVRIGTNLCNGCRFTTCNSSDVQPEFDCSNIVYSDQYGVLRYGPITTLCTTNDTMFPVDSPFTLFLRDNFQFAACYLDPSPAAQRTTIQPTSASPTNFSPIIVPSDGQAVYDAIFAKTQTPRIDSRLYKPTNPLDGTQAAATAATHFRQPTSATVSYFAKGDSFWNTMLTLVGILRFTL